MLSTRMHTNRQRIGGATQCCQQECTILQAQVRASTKHSSAGGTSTEMTPSINAKKNIMQHSHHDQHQLSRQMQTRTHTNHITQITSITNHKSHHNINHSIPQRISIDAENNPWCRVRTRPARNGVMWTHLDQVCFRCTRAHADSSREEEQSQSIRVPNRIYVSASHA